MAQTPDVVFRDYVTDGVPASGTWDPRKADIRALLNFLYTGVQGASAGGLIFDSKADLDADLDHAANSMAWVIGDSTAANNGIYQKSGASGSGSWTRIADLPHGYIKASNIGDGTADAIQATTSLPLPEADGAALIALNIFETNTGSPVTVSFNGGSALTIKGIDGNNVGAGDLTAGMLVAGYISGTDFRILVGPKGWSPLMRIISDGARRVLEVYDWTGGQGAKPSATGYVGAAGLSANISDGIDIRGPEGPSGPGTGDMLASVYDPGGVAGNAFDGMPVANRSALKALDTSLFASARLTEAGREGTFIFSGADHSSDILGPDIASTSVDAGTDIITSADHFLFTGNSVVVTSAVNGLSTDTIYYVINVMADGIEYDSETIAFTAGETLTGGTSGATATIDRVVDNGDGGIILLSNISGTFQDDETITDGAGGSATARGTVGQFRDPDTFKLATSFANAFAGTAVDLTAADPVIVKRHHDPTEGRWVIPNGLAIDGSQGAWVRDSDVVSIAHCGAKIDGTTDDAEAIWGAFEIATSDAYRVPVFFPRGLTRTTKAVWLSDLWVSIVGAGRGRVRTQGADHTTFKGGSAVIYDGDTLTTPEGLFNFGISNTTDGSGGGVSMRDIALFCQWKCDGVNGLAWYMGRLTNVYIHRPKTGVYSRFSGYSSIYEFVEVHDPETGCFDLRQDCHSVQLIGVLMNGDSGGAKTPEFGIRVGRDGNCSSVSIIGGNSDLYRVTYHVDWHSDCKGGLIAGLYIEGKGDGVSQNNIYLRGGSGRIIGGRNTTANNIDYGVNAVSTAHDWTIDGVYFSGFATAAVRRASGASNINVGPCEIDGAFSLTNDQGGISGHDYTSNNDGVLAAKRVKPHQLVLVPGATLTISSGAITVNGSRHLVDTSGGASEDLNTIDGGVEGQILILSTVSNSRAVVVKDAVGNINIAGDCTLASVRDRIMLEWDAGNSGWRELSRTTGA